ncbi:MAG: rhodanese-related sulfurtransferase, partial [Xanthomonadales bacterium]|nr:rhodanese-related sulfurtransferase [Xanthomonadales bacterium]
MITVGAFYRFTPLPDPAGTRDRVLKTAKAAGLRGTILLAPEGINGTVAGPRAGIEALVAALETLPGCEGLDWKESTGESQPFRRLKVRLKREIVTMGVADADPATRVGTYVAPADWDQFIDDPGTVVIDTRNDYETAIGSFDGAVDPGTASFSEFPAWWRQNRGRFGAKRIAMFCTGGIRCEKASSWLLAQGVPEVLHLKGGILKYLEEVPADQGRWRGECFVFDERVAIGPGLAQGSHALCHACGRPVAPS